jgi:hypothetical protein
MAGCGSTIRLGAPPNTQDGLTGFRIARSSGP